MSVHTRDLYPSANETAGAWSALLRFRSAFVRHEAATVLRWPIPPTSRSADFLSQGGHGPEKQELLRLIGSLTGA